jgi:hypothetical protein
LLETVVEISLQSHRYIFSALFLFFSVEHYWGFQVVSGIICRH